MIFRWQGIFPPSHKEFHDFNTILFDNIIYAISILGIYFFPFLLLRKNNMKIFTDLFNKKIFLLSSVILILVIFYVELFFIRPDFGFHSNLDGGGAIRKLSFVLFQNIIAQKIFLLLSVIVGWIIICSFLDKKEYLYYLILYYSITFYLSPLSRNI